MILTRPAARHNNRTRSNNKNNNNNVSTIAAHTMLLQGCSFTWEVDLSAAALSRVHLVVLPVLEPRSVEGPCFR